MHACMGANVDEGGAAALTVLGSAVATFLALALRKRM